MWRPLSHRIHPSLLQGRVHPLEKPQFQHGIGKTDGKIHWLQLLFSWSVVSDSLQPHGLQHARLPCPSLSPEVCSNSCSLNQRCHPTISSSVAPFSSSSQSFPTSVLPMNIQGWFALGLTGMISLLSKGLSKVFSSTTVQKHQFFGAQPSLWSNSHICT